MVFLLLILRIFFLTSLETEALMITEYSHKAYKAYDLSGHTWPRLVFEIYPDKKFHSRLECASHCVQYIGTQSLECQGFIWKKASEVCMFVQQEVASSQILPETSEHEWVYLEESSKIDLLDNTFFMLHDVPNLQWKQNIFESSANLTSESHEDCGTFCLLEHLGICEFYVLDEIRCHFGDLEETNGTAVDISATSLDVFIKRSSLTYYTNTFLDFTFASMPSSVWRFHIYKSITLISNSTMLECRGFCYFDRSQCEFAHVNVDGVCYLGKFSDDIPIPSPNSIPDRDIWTKRVFATRYIEPKYKSVTSIGSRWRNYIYKIWTFPTEEDCSLRCFHDADLRCSFYVHMQVTRECLFGALGNLLLTSVAPAANDLANIHLLRAFDRHTNHQDNYETVTTFGYEIWPKFIYDSVAGVFDDHQCATVCWLHHGLCHLFHLSNNTCFLGRFDYLTNGVLSDVNEGNFSMISEKYVILENKVAQNFDPYQSTGNEWRPYVYTTKEIIPFEECGMICLLQENGQCGYFVHENGRCHLGNLEHIHGNSSTENDTQTVYVFKEFSRHVPQDFKFELNEAFGSEIWPRFIYIQYDNVDDDHKCSSICLLDYGPCHLYKLIGTTCYLGNFNILHGQVLIPPVSGPFHQRPEYFSILTNTVNQLFIPYASHGYKYLAYIHKEKPEITNFEECAIFCFLDETKRCGYVIPNGQTCMLGNVENTGTIKTSTNVTDDVYILRSFDRHESQAPVRFFISDLAPKFDDNVWPKFLHSVVSDTKDSHECSTYCLLDKKQCELFFHSGTECYLGHFDHTSGGVLTSSSDQFYLANEAYALTKGYIKDPFLTFSSFFGDHFTHIFDIFPEPIQGRCALLCIHNSNSQCGYYVWENDICYFGNPDHYGGNVTNSSLHTIHLLRSTDRHADRFPNFTQNTQLSYYTWNKFIYEVLVDIDNYEQCATICHLIRGKCHLIQWINSEKKCLIGIFDTEWRNLITSIGHFYHFQGPYEKLILEPMAEKFDEYPGLSNWQNYIYRAFEASSIEQCKFECYADESCGYFVYVPIDCWLGDLNTSSSIPTPAVLAGTINIWNDYDRHSDQVPLHFTTSASHFGSLIWHNFIYISYSNINTTHQCSSLCLLEQGDCDLFALQGTDCYLGTFETYGGTVLTNSSGQFHYLVEKFVEEQQEISDNFVEFLGNGSTWPLHIYETQAPILSLEECALYCQLELALKCSFFIFESNQCHLGNPNEVSLSGPSSNMVTHIYTGSQRFTSRLAEYSLNTDFSANLWTEFLFNSYVNISSLEHCSIVCFLVEYSCDLFYYQSLSQTCFVGRFDHFSGQLLPPVDADFYQIQSEYDVLITNTINNIFDSYGHLGLWQKFVYKSWPTVTDIDECGILCHRDSNCAYFILNTYCYFGDFAGTPTNYAPTTSISVHVQSDFSKHANIASIHYDVSAPDFVTSAWNEMVYAEYPIFDSDHKCSSICLIEGNPCHFYAFRNNTCYLGNFDQDDGSILSGDNASFSYLPAELPRFLSAYYVTLMSTGNEWPLYVYSTPSAGSHEECATICKLDNNNHCSFFAYDSSLICSLGNPSSISGNISASSDQEIHILKSFDRHTSQLDQFTLNANYSEWLWHWFIYDQVADISSDEECSYICLLISTSCDLFYFDSSSQTCYVGRFNYTTGAILSGRSEPFYQLQTEYDRIITNDINSLYDSYPSKGTWKSYVHNTYTSTTNVHECGILCKLDVDCGFFVVDSTNCHLGNVLNDINTVVEGSDTLVTLYKYNDYSRHTSIVSTYFVPSTATFETSVWNELIYVAYPGISTEQECSSICLIEEGNCDLFKISSGICYLGNFNHSSDAILSGNNGTFYYRENILDLFVENHFLSLNSNNEWTFYIYDTTEGKSEKECSLSCHLDGNAKCSYFVFNNSVCLLGNPDTLVPEQGLHNSSSVVFLYRAFNRHNSQITKFEPNSTFSTPLWNTFIYDVVDDVRNADDCSVTCLLIHTSCDLFYYLSLSNSCYIGKFDYLNGGLLSNQQGQFYQIQSEYDRLVPVQFYYHNYPSNGSWNSFTYKTNAEVLTKDECGLLCRLDTPCNFFVIDGSGCHLGDINNPNLSVSPIYGDLDVYFLIDFSRQSTVISPEYTDSTITFSTSAWNKFIYASYGNVPFDYACSSVCKIERNTCQLFFHENSTCYLGNFDFNTGTLLTKQSGLFHYIEAELMEFKTSEFLEISSSIEEWTQYVYGITEGASLEECSVICKTVYSLDCSYFVHNGTGCFLGNTNTESPVMVANPINATVLILSTFDRHNSPFPLFTQANDFGKSTWPKFVFNSFTAAQSYDDCATLCLLVASSCDLIYFNSSTNICYVGKFDNAAGTLLLEQEGPYYQIQSEYDTLVGSKISSEFNQYPANEAWKDFIHETVPDVLSLNECGLLCRWDSTCGYFVFSMGCHLGNLQNSVPSLSDEFPALSVYMLGDYSRHSSLVHSKFENNQNFISDVWNHLVYVLYPISHGQHQCSSVCILEENHCLFFHENGTHCFLGNTTAAISGVSGVFGQVHYYSNTFYNFTSGKYAGWTPVYNNILTNSSTSSTNELECAMICIFDDLCTYFWFETGTCHIGTPANDMSSIISSNSEVKMINSLDKHVSSQAWFSEKSDFDDETWTKFIKFAAPAANEDVCSTYCLAQAECQIFWYGTNQCYYGDFSSTNGTVLSTTAAPYKFKTNSADFKSELEANSGHGCGNGNFYEVTPSFNLNLRNFNYSASQTCQWSLYNPRLERLNLLFNIFETEVDKDKLEVIYGYSVSSGVKSAILSGSQNGTTISTTNLAIVIHFVSDPIDNGNLGFDIEISLTP